RASSTLFLVPAVAAIAAWPLLGTPIVPLTVVGLALSAAGLRLIAVRPAAPAEEQQPAAGKPAAVVTRRG
ncbi:MAG: hypothetical protein QOF95_411, partial [Pseudonocardiales bacterium]|nr:hypothetical protein [Pseudonocardiales bacterium]